MGLLSFQKSGEKDAVIRFLWNYGEFDENRRVLVEEGLLQAFIADLEHCDLPLYDAILGALWGFVEYAQVAVSLRYCVPFLLRGLEQEGNKEMELHALGVLHMIVARGGGADMLAVPDLLRLVETREKQDPMICFVAAHIIACLLEQVVVVPSFSLQEEARLTLVLADYVKVIDVPALRRIEKERQFRWVGLDPFLSLLISQRKPVLELCALTWGVMLVNPWTLKGMPNATIERVHALCYHPVVGQLASKWIPSSGIVPSLKALCSMHCNELGL